MRSKVYFVSDVHLGLDVADKDSREARFVSFLRSIRNEGTKALYMLGDIWDFWYEYRDVVPKGYARVFSSIMDLIDDGIEVFFFTGNHDIWTFGYLESMGIKVLKQPYYADICGKNFCLGHGDGLGPGLFTYKLMRGAFRSRFLQALFSTLHPWLAFRLGTGWSKKSRLARSDEYVFKGKDEPLYKFAETYSSERPVDFFIFGHFHTHVDMSLPAGSRLIVLGDWLNASPYFLYDGGTGTTGYSPNIDQ